MNKKLLLPLLLVTLSVALVNCAKDPTEGVAPAEVSDAGAGAAASSSDDDHGDGVAFAFTNDSVIGFEGSKVTGSHSGGFKKFSGEFFVDVDHFHPEGSKVVIDMNSTWSDNPKLTGHLQSADFFDVQQYPEASFALKSAEKKGAQYQVTGDLTLHGVTKQIAFPAEISLTPELVTFKAKFKIDRFDFKIEYPGKADNLIRKDVNISLDLKAKPKAA